MWSSDVECAFMPSPNHMAHSKIESNRRFLLRNRSNSIVHLKAGIATALINIGDTSKYFYILICLNENNASQDKNFNFTSTNTAVIHRPL